MTAMLDIIFAAAHPDDLEITCGGTIAKLVKLGYRVGMVHLTDGEPTPRGTPQIRAREARAAADVLGAAACEILDLPNRLLMDSPQSRTALAVVLRRHRPRVLVSMAGRTPAASPDHYQAQLIVEGARFYSQLTKWEDRFAGTEPHRVDHLLYRPVLFAAELNVYPSSFVVDITDSIEQKLQAIRCYRSQFPDDRFEGLAHHVRSMAGAEGGRAGFRYGELYALPRMLGLQDPLKALGEWQIPPPWAYGKT